MKFGPVQLLVLGFPTEEMHPEIAAELERLRRADVVRVVDLLVVRKDMDGTVHALERTDLSDEESAQLGALAAQLMAVGAGDADLTVPETLSDQDVWYVADAVPPGSTAAIVLLEHTWAVPLRDAVGRAGGVAYLDEWIHPEDLVALGAELAAAPS